MSRAGTARVAQVADGVGLTQALSRRLPAFKQRRRGHDLGRVICDLAVMLADGGQCVSDLGAVREHNACSARCRLTRRRFRWSTGSRLSRNCWSRSFRARAGPVLGAAGASERLTLDIDATLITAHSEKQKAAGNLRWRLRVRRAKAEPRRLRYRLLRAAGWLAFSGRRVKLNLRHTWPWASELLAALLETQDAPARYRLTQPAGDPTAASRPPGTGHDHGCPQIPARPAPAAPWNRSRSHHHRQRQQPPLLTTDRVPPEYLSAAYCTFRANGPEKCLCG